MVDGSARKDVKAAFRHLVQVGQYLQTDAVFSVEQLRNGICGVGAEVGAERIRAECAGVAQVSLSQ